MAKRYIHYLKEMGQGYRLDEYRAIEKGVTVYRIWQRGGGFDRNVKGFLKMYQKRSFENVPPEPTLSELWSDLLSDFAF